MEEFLFDGKSARDLLDRLRALNFLSGSGSGFGSAEDVPTLLGLSPQQASALRERSAGYARQRSRRVSDWVAFLIEVNSIICASRRTLRNSSVALVGPEPWMCWTAPPEDIRNRLHDVVAIVVTSSASVATLSTIFPALILLHPFMDGNCRSALVFLEVYNRIHQVADASLIAAAYMRLRLDRIGVSRALSSMRLHKDVLPYTHMLNQAVGIAEIESRGATAERMST